MNNLLTKNLGNRGKSPVYEHVLEKKKNLGSSRSTLRVGVFVEVFSITAENRESRRRNGNIRGDPVENNRGDPTFLQNISSSPFYRRGQIFGLNPDETVSAECECLKIAHGVYHKLCSVVTKKKLNYNNSA